MEYEYLPTYLNSDTETIANFMVRMPKQYQNLAIKLYGPNYTNKINKNNLSGIEKLSFISVLKSIKKYFQEKDYYIWDMIGCSKKEFASLIKTINPKSYYYAVLVKTCSPKLTRLPNLSKLNNSELGAFNEVIRTLQSNYQKLISDEDKEENIGGTLQEILDCSTPELELFKSALNVAEAEVRRVFMIIFGPKLNHKCNLFNLTDEQLKIYYRWLEIGKSSINDVRTKEKVEETSKPRKPRERKPKVKKEIKKYLYEQAECSREELQIVLDSGFLNKEDKSYQELTRVYGLSLDEELKVTEEEINKSLFTQGINKIKKLKSAIIDNKMLPEHKIVVPKRERRNSNNYLYETVGCSLEEYKILLKTLDPNAKYYEILKKLYGPNLLERKKSYYFTRDDKEFYDYAKKALKKTYHEVFLKNVPLRKYLKANYYLYEYLDIPKERLIELTTSVYFDESTKYYQLFQELFGLDFCEIIDYDRYNKMDTNEYWAFNHTIKNLDKLYQSVYIDKKLNLDDGIKQNYHNPHYLYEMVDCSYETLMAVINSNYFNKDKYLKALQSEFGENLDQVQVKQSSNERVNIRDILKRIRNILDDVNAGKKELTKPEYLWEKVNIPKDELDIILNSDYINKKAKYYRSLQEGFGYSLDQAFNPFNVKDKNALYTALDRLNKLYQEIFVAKTLTLNDIERKKKMSNTNIYLWDIIGCTQAKLEEMVNSEYYSKKTAYAASLQKVFGPNLDQVRNKEGLTLEEDNAYQMGIERLNKIYHNRASTVPKDTKLHERVGCTYEELLELINCNRFQKDKKAYNALKKACGENFDQVICIKGLLKSEKMAVYNGIRFLKKLNERRKSSNYSLNKEKPYLWEMIECEPNELYLVMPKIKPESKREIIMKQMFGENLDERRKDVPENLSMNAYALIADLKEYYQVLKTFRDEKLEIHDYLNCRKEDAQSILEVLDYDYHNYYAILVKATNNFTSYVDINLLNPDEKLELRNIMNLLKRRLVNLQEEKQENNIYVGLCLNEIIGCEKEKLPLLMENLSTGEANIIMLVFGYKLDLTYQFHGLNKNHKKRLNDALIKLQEIYLNSIKTCECELLLPDGVTLSKKLKVLISNLATPYNTIATSLVIGEDLETISKYLNMDKLEIIKISRILYNWLSNINEIHRIQENKTLEDSEYVLKLLAQPSKK